MYVELGWCSLSEMLLGSSWEMLGDCVLSGCEALALLLYTQVGPSSISLTLPECMETKLNWMASGFTGRI